MLALTGPRMVVLSVERVQDYELFPPGPMAEQVAGFRAALGT